MEGLTKLAFLIISPGTRGGGAGPGLLILWEGCGGNIYIGVGVTGGQDIKERAKKIVRLLCKDIKLPQFSDLYMHQLIFFLIRWRQLQLHQPTEKCSQISNKSQFGLAIVCFTLSFIFLLDWYDNISASSDQNDGLRWGDTEIQVIPKIGGAP